MKLRVMFEPDEGDWFHVWCPDLPGCHSQGETIEEAKANIKEAIEVYLEVVLEDAIVANLKKSRERGLAHPPISTNDHVEAHFRIEASV